MRPETGTRERHYELDCARMAEIVSDLCGEIEAQRLRVELFNAALPKNKALQELARGQKLWMHPLSNLDLREARILAQRLHRVADYFGARVDTATIDGKSGREFQPEPRNEIERELVEFRRAAPLDTARDGT